MPPSPATSHWQLNMLPLGMGKLTSHGFAVLTAMVEEHGEANIVEEVAGRIAEGDPARRDAELWRPVFHLVAVVKG